jgi:hypothetical protein
MPAAAALAAAATAVLSTQNKLFFVKNQPAKNLPDMN